MSYDFQLFRVPDGTDPISAYESHCAQEKAKFASRRRGEDSWGYVDASKEQMKRQLSSALIAAHPELQLSERDYAKLAKTKAISEDEARRRYRDLELTDLESGLQVTLFDDAAFVTLSFGPTNRNEAERRFHAAWECLRLLEKDGGFSTYDSQTGRILQLNSDSEIVLHAYVSASGIVKGNLRHRPI